MDVGALVKTLVAVRPSADAQDGTMRHANRFTIGLTVISAES